MAITLLQIKTQARQRADMENSKFVSDAELLTYINNSIAELHDLLVATYGPDYYIESTSFATVTNTDSYTLPANFYKLKGVDVLVSGTDYYSLRPFNFNERNKNQYGSTGILGAPELRYRLSGNNIKFSPTPVAAHAIKLWYVPIATALVLDTDSYADFNGYIEYVITDVAIKMLQKEESDVSILSAQKMDLRKRIENMAQNRDAEQPDSVSDIYAENDEFWTSRS